MADKIFYTILAIMLGGLVLGGLHKAYKDGHYKGGIWGGIKHVVFMIVAFPIGLLLLAGGFFILTKIWLAVMAFFDSLTG